MLHLHHAFVLPGSDTPLPPGRYELIKEEERLQGLTFDAYRRTGAYLVVESGPRASGRTELRSMTGDDLTHLIAQDAAHIAAECSATQATDPAAPGEPAADRSREDNT